MAKRKSSIHIEPKQPAPPQMTPEQLVTLLASPEFAAFATAYVAAVRAILAARQPSA